MNLINHQLLFFLVFFPSLVIFFFIFFFLSLLLSLLHDSHSHSMQTPGESPSFLSPLLSLLLSNQRIVIHPHPPPDSLILTNSK